MPTESLDDWKEAVHWKIKCQAFINASLGPRDPCGTWNNHRKQHYEKSRKWKLSNTYQKGEKNPDAMDVDVTQV
jgi:hypothetical protein